MTEEQFKTAAKAWGYDSSGRPVVVTKHLVRHVTEVAVAEILHQCALRLGDHETLLNLFGLMPDDSSWDVVKTEDGYEAHLYEQVYASRRFYGKGETLAAAMREAMDARLASKRGEE